MQLSNHPVFVVAAVIQLSFPMDNISSDRVLIVRRGPTQSGAGFWEFPGGKVEINESPEEALRREIQEELGLLIQVKELLGEYVHDYPTKRIRLRVYMATAMNATLRLHEHDDAQWLRAEELKAELLSEADRPFVEKLVLHMQARKSRE